MQTLSLGLLRSRTNLQPRLQGLDQDTVQDYVEALERGAVFPPIVAFKLPDGEIVLVDGWHRVAAYKACKRLEVPARIIEGTPQEAYDYAWFEANRENGRRLTRKDVRRIAEAHVNDPRFADLNHRQFAKAIGVSESLAYSVINSHRTPSVTSAPVLEERDFTNAAKALSKSRAVARIFAQMYTLLSNPEAKEFVSPHKALQLIELLQTYTGGIDGGREES